MVDRREFLTTAAGLAGAALLAAPAEAVDRPAKFAAIAFDAFPIFDPRPVAALCEALFPSRGGELVAMWRTRQFEYAWLRSLSKSYADFESVTEDSLTFATKALKLELTAEKRAQLLQAHFQLKAWPDAAPALTKLKALGVRLAFLSNFTQNMLDGCIKASGLGGMFDLVLSTDSARTYKPDPRAYQMGLDAFGLKHEEIVFAASASWDAAGAKAFGYPSFWVNRANLPVEALGVAPDAIGSGMAELVTFIAG